MGVGGGQPPIRPDKHDSRLEAREARGGATSERRERRGITRREFLRTSIALAAAATAAPLLRSVAGVSAESGPETSRVYYEYFIVDNDKERLEYYSAMGLVREINGRKCVANPLLPDRCVSYFKPYEEDRFPIKPPGATKDFFSRCIRCGLCYYQCHYVNYNAIKLAGIGDGDLKMLGTPVIVNQRENPCTLCMECTIVCPTGALSETLEEAKRRYRRELEEECKKKGPKELGVETCEEYVKQKLGTVDRTLLARYPDLLDKTRMGVAMIDPDLCWAWNSGDCKSCAKACPFGMEVFDFIFTEWGVHTRVKAKVREDGTIETKCVGCGLCVAACPVVGSAIHVLPEDEYVRRYRNFKNTGMSYEEYLQKILEVENTDPATAVIRSMEINNAYILDVRGFHREKVVTELAPASGNGKPGSTRDKL